MQKYTRRAYLEMMGIQAYVRRDVVNEEMAEQPAEVVDTSAEATETESAAPVMQQQSVEVQAVESAPSHEPMPDLDAYMQWDGQASEDQEQAWDDDHLPSSDEKPAQPDIATLDWETLKQRVSECQRCELCQSRTQSVFGVGNANADVLIVGEAPGAEEDKQGEPFVGRAGKLLDNMLKAIGLDREQVFIANILKCRPPNNRNPSIEEAAACEPYLKRQIDLIQPKIILSVGGVSAHNLLKTDESVGKLRNRQHRYGQQQLPLLVTYHPAYLLRKPSEKAKSWDDLQKLKQLIKETE